DDDRAACHLHGDANWRDERGDRARGHADRVVVRCPGRGEPPGSARPMSAQQPKRPGLEVSAVKHLPGFTLEADWDADDKVVALFGPSGAGKTLTLQCLAGLVRPDRGRIVVNGTVFYDSGQGIDIPPQKRRLGYVFQGYALFPHLSVADNVAYGL